MTLGLVACGGATRTVVQTVPAPAATATTARSTTPPPVPASAIDAAEAAVTPVTCVDPNRQGNGFDYYEGTAFQLVNGDAISASHVVSACGVGAPLELGQVGVSGTNGDGSLANPNTEVTKNDTTNDVAVVRGVPTLAGLAVERAPLHAGDQVALIGFPGIKGSITAPRQVMVTTGTVTAVGTPRTLNAPLPEGALQETLTDAISVAAAAKAGESGGLAIDAQGKVIGVIEGTNAEETTLTPVSDLPLPPSADPVGPTTLKMGPEIVVEPTEVAFSADGGNIVTNVAWTSWTATSAVGSGTSMIQHCVPDCADGSEAQVPATLELSNPRGGHFTKMVETRNGTSTTWTYPRSWPFP
jgi:Trypsin-like peptidase domain